MTIVVDIAPEAQVELARKAAEHGRAIEAYAAKLLGQAAHLPGGAGRLSQDRLEYTLLEMAQFSHRIPSLPDEALTRESLYQDHYCSRFFRMRLIFLLPCRTATTCTGTVSGR
jgi:hypothetical protein